MAEKSSGQEPKGKRKKNWIQKTVLRVLASLALISGAILLMVRACFGDVLSSIWKDSLPFSGAILLVIAVCVFLSQFIPSITPYFFDNEEYNPNQTLEELVEKLRWRTQLFNNVAVAIFVVIMVVIIVGFVLLIIPPSHSSPANPNGSFLSDSVATRVGATVLIIFLVQILFRVFKYLLRIGCFYNGIADTIEFSQMPLFKNLELGGDFIKLMESLTPEKYDISDLQSPSLTDLVKSSVGKNNRVQSFI
jgi:hypothetical protein